MILISNYVLYYVVLVHFARQNAIAKITASVVASAAIEQAQWSMVSLITTTCVEFTIMNYVL